MHRPSRIHLPQRRRRRRGRHQRRWIHCGGTPFASSTPTRTGESPRMSFTWCRDIMDSVTFLCDQSINLFVLPPICKYHAITSSTDQSIVFYRYRVEASVGVGNQFVFTRSYNNLKDHCTCKLHWLI